MSVNDRPNEQSEGVERHTQGSANLSHAAFAEMRMQSATNSAQTSGEANVSGLNFGNTAQLYGNEALGNYSPFANIANASPFTNYENVVGNAEGSRQWQDPGFFPRNYGEQSQWGAYDQFGQNGPGGPGGSGSPNGGFDRDGDRARDHDREGSHHRSGHHHGGHHHCSNEIDPVSGQPTSPEQPIQTGQLTVPGMPVNPGDPPLGTVPYSYGNGNMQWGLGDGTGSMYSQAPGGTGTAGGDNLPAQPSSPTDNTAPTSNGTPNSFNNASPTPSDNTSTNAAGSGSASDANNLSNLANATYKITAIDNSQTGDYGTGFAATLNGGKNNGLIVTDEHVIQGAQSITLTGSDGQTYSAKVVKEDPNNDLAILQIQGAPANGAAINVDANTNSLGSGTVETAGHAQGETGLTTGTGTIDGTTTYGNAGFVDSTVQQDNNRALLKISNLGTEGGQSGSAIIDKQTGQLIGNVEAGNGDGKTPSTLTLANTSTEIANDLAAAQTAVG